MQQFVQQHLMRFSRCTRCDVVIGESRHGRGGVYDVSVRLAVPGEPLYAAHVSEASGSRDVLYGAVSFAFDDIKRQLIKRRGRRQRRHHLRTAEMLAA
jgi:ribosome-associated translation inhibitor RaiA